MHDHSNTRRKLSDILDGDTDSIREQWDKTEAADDFAPLPGGVYVARIVVGELTNAKTGTPGYKLEFKVLEGEHTGRHFWTDIWLTPAALPMAKRDLGKLGVTSLDQLEQPLPPGIRCKVRLVLRRDDDGTDYNRVRSFEVVGIDEPELDAFAPNDDAGDDDAVGSNTPEVSDGGNTDTKPDGDGDEHRDTDSEAATEAGGDGRGGDEGFNFGANATPDPKTTDWARR